MKYSNFRRGNFVECHGATPNITFYKGKVGRLELERLTRNHYSPIANSLGVVQNPIVESFKLEGDFFLPLHFDFCEDVDSEAVLTRGRRVTINSMSGVIQNKASSHDASADGDSIDNDRFVSMRRCNVLKVVLRVTQHKNS